MQGPKCQRSNGGVLGRALLCPVGLNGSLTRTETKLFSARLSEIFLPHVCGFFSGGKLGSSRHECDTPFPGDAI